MCIEHPSQNYLTAVGAFSLAFSHYGTFDQAGSTFEWTDTHVSANRVIRGGSWGNDFGAVRSTNRGISNPLNEDYGAGFRVATIPEPGIFGLLGVGAALTAYRRKRRRCNRPSTD